VEVGKEGVGGREKLRRGQSRGLVGGEGWRGGWVGGGWGRIVK